MNTKAVLEKDGIVTIPESITGKQELVVLSRRTFEALLSHTLTEERILKLSKEAKQLKKKGALPILTSLANLR